MNASYLNMVDNKIWFLLGLIWLLWMVIRARKARQPPSKNRPRWKLLRDKPADWKDAIYNPRELRKPRK